MSEKNEYSYNELDENEKTNAVFDIDSMVRAFLGLYPGTGMVDRPLIECMISDLDSVFDKNGRSKYYSKKYTEVTKVLIKDIYEKCKKVT